MKNILPSLSNEFITIIKTSSQVSVIGIGELMYAADTIRGNQLPADGSADSGSTYLFPDHFGILLHFEKNREEDVTEYTTCSKLMWHFRMSTLGI